MLIIVCFSVLKKSRILIAILSFLSTLKRTRISAFVSLLFINGISFSVETTLASKNYLKIIDKLKKEGWQVNMIYLYLPSVDLSIQRVAERVKNGGHNIKTVDIKRRYDRSIRNLINDYFNVIDALSCLNNENNSVLIFNKNAQIFIYNQKIYNNILAFKNA